MWVGKLVLCALIATAFSLSFHYATTGWMLAPLHSSPYFIGAYLILVFIFPAAVTFSLLVISGAWRDAALPVERYIVLMVSAAVPFFAFGLYPFVIALVFHEQI